MSTTINLDELRAEVERLSAVSRTYPKGFTTREFAESMGIHISTAKTTVSSLVRAGHAKFAGTRPTQRIDGKSSSTPVYQLVKPVKKKA